jgi:hypothetical protein
LINDFGVRRIVRESKGGALDIGVFSIRARGCVVVKTMRFVKVKTQDL